MSVNVGVWKRLGVVTINPFNGHMPYPPIIVPIWYMGVSRSGGPTIDPAVVIW